MHWTRVSLFCLGAALLASSQSAFAQVVNEETGVVQLEDVSGSMSLSNDGGSWMQVDRMSGDGVGFQTGYTRIGIRTKLADFGESHVFTELNGTMNDHSRLGTNLNVGYRTMYDGGVLGVHGGYDHYESNYGHKYQQAVIGAEYLHQWMDFRANGYMPFGDRDNFIGVIDPGSELTFFGHDFGTIGVGQVERSLAGFDAEVGAPLPVATFLKLFGGTYFLTANDEDTWGVRSRLEARVGESSTISFMVSDDDRFGTNLNLNATIWYGGGPSSPFKFQRDRGGASRKYDPIRRAQTVQLAQDHEAVNVALTNAETDERFNIIWVDNTAPAGGDGTYEHPYNSLPDSATGADYILVKTGSGNTVGNITLEDNQRLWGEGQAYTLSTVELGEVTIPDAYFSQTGDRPELVAADATLPIVTLADNNEVINFNMTGGGVGIYGDVVNDFRIEDVAIDADNGIYISDASGTGILDNIDVVADGTGTGVFIRAIDDGQLDLIMTDITATDGSFGLQLLADGSTVNATIDGLVTDDTSDTAVVLEQYDGLLNVDLENVDVGSNTNDGILIYSVLGETNVNMDNVTVQGAGTLLNVSGTSTEITLNATDVDFSNSAGSTGVMIDIDDTTGTFNFTNLTASNNNDDGFRLNAENLSVVDVNISDSDVVFNGNNNFDVSASGGSVVDFDVDSTTATDSGAEAFAFVATDVDTVLNSTFIDVDLARAGESAISGVVTDGAVSDLILSNVQASDSGLHGLTVSVTNSADFVATITDSTFSGNGLGTGGRGVNLFIDNNSTVQLDMTDTLANNNGSEGFHYEVSTDTDGGSSLIANVTNGDFSDNPDTNVYGQVTGAGSSATLNFTDVTADLQGANGSVQLASLDGGLTDVVWTGANSSISQSDADGVNLTADGAGSILNFAFSDGSINSNGGQGIDALATDGGAIQIDLNDAEVTFNTDENILAVAQTGSEVFVNALNSDLSNGGLTTNLDNVQLNADGAGSTVGGIFDSVNLDNSGQHGLNAVVTDLASLDLQFLTSDSLNPSSASNNANGSGIRIGATNADSITVVSSGDSVISDNSADNVDIDVIGANFASIQIAGLMDGSLTGDGVNVNYDAVLSGGIDIGGGSASDNADDGVDITVANSNLDLGISVSDMTVTGNGDEPIVVYTTNSTITDGSIDGNTTDGGNNGISWTSDSGTVDVNIQNNTITNATDNGILVTLSGTAVGNEVHIDDNTVTGDSLTPLNGIQLNLSDDAVLTNGTISGNSASSAASYGILVDVTDNALVDVLNIDANTVSSNGIDGILYTASGNTTLNNLVISDNSVDLNADNGINVLLDSVLGDGNVEFRGNLASSNGGDGILITGVNTSLTNLDFLSNETTSNGGNGILVDMSSGGAETLASVYGQDNIASNNAANGIQVLIDGFSTTVATDVIWESTTASANGARGLSLELSNMDFGDVVVSGSAFTTNGSEGVAIEVTAANVENVVIDSSTSESNAGAGALIATTGSTVDLLQVSNNNSDSGSGLSNNGGSGLQLDLDSSVINNFLIESNLIDANAVHGIEMNVTGGTTLPLISNSLVSGNTITNHAAGDGFHLVNPDTGGTDFGINFDGNTITDNTGGSGVNLTLNGDSGIMTATFTNNEISNNGNSGLLVSLTETADLQIINFENNTLTSNTEMGVRILTEDTSNFLLDGSLGNNLFDSNSDAGIGAVLSDSSTADIRMANSTITNTTAGSLADFSGQGVKVLAENSAELLGTSLIDGNTITENAGNGVELLVRDTAVIGGMTINDNTINNSGTYAVSIERQDTGAVGSDLDRLEISGNIITSQTEGVFIIAANNDSTDYYEMNDNDITGMTGAGVHFEVRADADIDVNMDNNLISENGTDGILVTEEVNSASDSRSVTGIWSNNVITDNGRHGINLSGTTESLLIETSTISGNANDGISITGAGSVTISSNLISENGSNGGDDAGIDFSGATYNEVTIVNNAIVNNHGDGIEYEGDGSLGSVAVITGNDISFNDGRGLDLLVQPSSNGYSSVDMTFNDNNVTNNLLEGVYIIFTASETQTQDVDSTTALNSDGDVDSTPYLVFNSDGNVIEANGVNSGLSTTGMVVRVGTTQASNSTTDDGGFASDGYSGVIMSVTNTTFSGNFGDDVYFDSFTSTVDPATTSGTWNATTYTVTSYTSDPLARLDLTFSDNTFDSVDVNNTGAYYDNAEGTFKSRTDTQTDAGPFTSSTRRRNAQRQAARIPNATDPSTPGGASDTYLYSGLGESTFRVNGNQTYLFSTDDDPYVTTGSANGVFLGGSITGELPYGWGTF